MERAPYPKISWDKEIHIRDWNGHPVDVSPARHLLTKLGFVKTGSRHKGFIYDGLYKPDSLTIEEAEQEIPEVFEYDLFSYGHGILTYWFSVVGFRIEQEVKSVELTTDNRKL